MPLSKEDRISFSKKIVEGEAEKRGIESSKAATLNNRQQAFDLDEGNRRLAEPRNMLINGYHVEMSRYNGILRTSITEQDIQDASNLVLNNNFYPNNPNLPPPSLAPATWTRPKPYARNKAVGRQFNEMFPAAFMAEQAMITEILGYIAEIETFPLIQRVTGQICIPGGTCSIPIHTNQAACELNGGIWTPGPDMIVPNTDLLAVYNDLLAAINALDAYVTTTQGLIITNDFDSARQAQNNVAIANINIIRAAIAAWLALDPFNDDHGQVTCAGFNAYNPALLGPTRLQLGNLNTLELAITNRQTFVGVRVMQIDTNLGTINQNLMTGDFTGTGLYFERWNFIGLRLNFYGGSLIAYNSLNKSIEAQTAFQDQITLSISTYATVLTCSPLSAKTNGTKNVHLKSASGFLPGDTVYLIANSQEELVLKVESINGNTLVVGTPVPAKYLPSDSARLYKDKL